MHTTPELLDLAKERLAERFALEKPVSDYRLAKLLRVHTTTLSNWRTGYAAIGAQHIGAVADATGLHPEYVYACVEHERAKLPEIRGILQRIAMRYAPVAASISLALTSLHPHL